MAYAGAGTITVTTLTGSAQVPADEFKTWVRGADLGPVVLPDATAYSLNPLNSGRIHVVPDLTSTATIKTPAPVAGLTYTLWYGGAAADAQDFVVNTMSDTNYFVGGVVFLDQDGDAISGVYSDGNSNSKFTVIKPEVGTEVTIRCDGTLWYINGRVHSATVPTMADQ